MPAAPPTPCPAEALMLDVTDYSAVATWVRITVGAVEVRAGAVPEVRPDDRDPAARFHRGVQLAERGGDRVLAGQVLEEAGQEHAVEVFAGQDGVHDVGNDHFTPGGLRHALAD